MNCRYCNERYIRKGKQQNIQIYQYKSWSKYQQQTYQYQSKLIENHQISQLVKKNL